LGPSCGPASITLLPIPRAYMVQASIPPSLQSFYSVSKCTYYCEEFNNISTSQKFSSTLPTSTPSTLDPPNTLHTSLFFPFCGRTTNLALIVSLHTLDPAIRLSWNRFVQRFGNACCSLYLTGFVLPSGFHKVKSRQSAYSTDPPESLPGAHHLCKSRRSVRRPISTPQILQQIDLPTSKPQATISGRS